MRFILSVIISGLLALPATAQPWYVRGEFNGWETVDPLTEQGDNLWTATIFANSEVDYEYKIATAEFPPAEGAIAIPGSNGKVRVTTGDGFFGEINFNFWDIESWNDGWFPNNQRRVGYVDHGLFDWEIVGSFNDWPVTGTPGLALIDQGNGLHTGTFTFDPGAYSFKFRQQSDWNTNIGGDFGNSAGDNDFRVWSADDEWTFELDLPNGRWRAFTTAPSPDLNNDQYVDARDYVLWRKSDNTQPVYEAWRTNFGTAPPPPPPDVFYARGSWNGFDLSDPMDDQGGGLFTKTITGLTAGTEYDFKVANPGYTQEAPVGPHNVRLVADANGEINMRFWDVTSWSDGWSPSDQRRVGYLDHDQYDWELMGSWSGFATPTAVIDLGNGLHRAEIELAESATGYGFKFRKEDDWDTTIGANFGNFGPNAQTGPIAAGTWRFELDLPNGRWRVVSAGGGGGSAVPEPGSLALALIVGLVACGVARRR